MCDNILSFQKFIHVDAHIQGVHAGVCVLVNGNFLKTPTSTQNLKYPCVRKHIPAYSALMPVRNSFALTHAFEGYSIQYMSLQIHLTTLLYEFTNTCDYRVHSYEQMSIQIHATITAQKYNLGTTVCASASSIFQAPGRHSEVCVNSRYQTFETQHFQLFGSIKGASKVDQDKSRVHQECIKSTSKVPQECIRSVSEVHQEYIKGASRVYQKCIKSARAFVASGQEYHIHIYVGENMNPIDNQSSVCLHLLMALARAMRCKTDASNIDWLTDLVFSVKVFDVANTYQDSCQN